MSHVYPSVYQEILNRLDDDAACAEEEQTEYMYPSPDKPYPAGPYYIPGIAAIFEGAEERARINAEIEEVRTKVSLHTFSSPRRSSCEWFLTL